MVLQVSGQLHVAQGGADENLPFGSQKKGTIRKTRERKGQCETTKVNPGMRILRGRVVEDNLGGDEKHKDVSFT